MPTIEELFKSKKLLSGKTAEEQYDVRNIADLRRNPYNALMGPSFRIAEITRRNLSTRKGETKIEAELTGLRILANTSSPLLYGTDIIKFTTKTRNIVDDMKNGANGVSNAGILGTFLNKAENLGKDLLSKVGVKLPQQLIPSRLAANKDFGTIGPLGPGAKPGGEMATMIRLQNIKAESAGNLFGKFLADNLKGKPIGNQIIGSALEIGKKALNKLLLGSPSEAARNQAKLGDIGDAALYASDFPYSRTVLPYADEGSLFARNDLSSKYNTVFPQKELVGYNPQKYVRPNVIKNQKVRFSANPQKITDSIESKRGMYSGVDYLNQMVSYPSKDGLKNDLIKDSEKQLDEYDFVTLKFWSVYKKAAVNFRATVNGLSETLAPSWDTNKFIGNPFNFYTYNSIERTVTFNFKIYSLNYVEHVAAWQRLNFLTSLTYPQGYQNGIGIAAPFIKFTLGDMFRNKEAYIDSLTYTIDDNTPWEVGLNDSSVKNFKLPTVVSVDITLKLLENKFSTFTKRLYGYGGVSTEVDIESDKIKELNRDGSPKLKEAGQKSDLNKEKNAKSGEPAANPSTEKPQKARNPKGELVLKYKDYNIYKKETGKFKQMKVWDGDRLVRTGPESRSDLDSALIEYEKRAIDEIENERERNLRSDVTNLVTPQF
jgi:hypothetical protein